MSHTYPQRRGNKETIQIFHLATKKRRRGNRKAKGDGETEEENKKEKKKKRERKEKEGSRDPDLVAREKSTRLTASVRQNFSPSPPISPPCVPSPGKKKNRRLTGRAPLETAEREKERKKEGRKREGNVRRN